MTRKTQWEVFRLRRNSMVVFLRILIIRFPKSQFKWKESRIRVQNWEMDLILLHQISRAICLTTCHRKNNKSQEPAKDFKLRSEMIKIWSKITWWKSFSITRQKLKKRELRWKIRLMLRYKFIETTVKYLNILTGTIKRVRMQKSVECSKKSRPRILLELD